jgi:hypothetical protein
VRPIRVEFWITCVCVAFAAAGVGATVWDLAVRFGAPAARRPWMAAEAAVFAVIVVMLAWGGLAYQLARAGFFWRLLRGAAAIPAGSAAEGRKPWLAVLIPSYREEPKTVLPGS